MKASLHFFQTLPTTSREVRAYSNISMGKQISQYTMSTLKQKNELRILIADFDKNWTILRIYYMAQPILLWRVLSVSTKVTLK